MLKIHSHLLKFLTFTLLLGSSIPSRADEGMWLPILLEKYNIEAMQEKGCKLTAEDIYSINQASLKDAVVGLVRTSSPFHNFCTGELISNEGLFITNHHCGYRQIQQHSSVEHDYLTDGFWAMQQSDELPNEGIGAALFKRMEDVTEKVLANIPEDASDKVQDSIITAHIASIEEEAVAGTHYQAKVHPFFAGNEYYLTVIEVFKDVRLVGAPPSAIGKFGGDTDNWMWPRHTGDFSLFRIYADTTNMPADIDDDNVPYHPIKHFEISLKGVHKGDFTMVYGYPGTTEEYLPSYAVKMRAETINPIRIDIRTQALNIMKADMQNDAKVRIQYSAKVAGMANGWKKWIGENRGLKRLNAIEKKQELEKEFQQWVKRSFDRGLVYDDIIGNYAKLYTDLEEKQAIYTYMSETVFNMEMVTMVRNLRDLLALNSESDEETIQKTIAATKAKAEKLFKDYNRPTDQKLFALYISTYNEKVAPQYQPESFHIINQKFNGDARAYADDLFASSILNNKEELYKFLDTYSPKKSKKLRKDAIFQLYSQVVDIYYEQVRPDLIQINLDLTKLDKIYMQGLREFQADKTFYPDANSTLRIAYGVVDDYKPRDAVYYTHQTSLKGIMEKDNPDIYDYRVPERLKELYENADFGRYADSSGYMPVCFTASNHTTGGNSGSPVLNAEGQLIGINFDRNWEGTMSDLMYDPEMCRNISLDIRYALFLIDKFAGASHLIEEMTLVE